MAAPLLLISSLHLAVGDLPVVTVLHGDVKAKPGDCQSWWCPQLLVTNANTTILSAQCKSPPPGKINPNTQLWIRSSDAGQTWTAPAKRPFFGTDVGQPVYSRRTSTVLWLGNAGQTAATEFLPTPKLDMTSPSCGPMDLCWASQLPRPSAKQLEACASRITRSTDDGVTFSVPQLVRVNNSLGPHYTGGDINHGIEIQRGPFAGRLALAHHLGGCRAMPSPNEQVEKDGRGRPRQTPGVDGAYTRVYVLYSDDHGLNWSAGQLLPVGWTESQLAEMSNGSLVSSTSCDSPVCIGNVTPAACAQLMTGRMDGAPWWPGSGPDHHYNKTNVMNRNRGFARSDDGGRTWRYAASSCWLDCKHGLPYRRAELFSRWFSDVWYLSARKGDRQPEIGILDTFVNEALTSSASTMYWAHPQNVNRTRSNYTLHSSSDGGASWTFVNRVYAGGAGYSDAIVVRCADD